MNGGLRRLLTAACVCSLAACYSFSPLETQPGSGQEARVRLTDLGTAVLGPAVGVGVVALRGRILALDTANVTMSVVAVTTRNELEESWLGERVVIQRQYVAGFDRRELSKGRSILLAGGVVFGVSALFAAVAVNGGDFSRIFGTGSPR